MNKYKLFDMNGRVLREEEMEDFCFAIKKCRTGYVEVPARRAMEGDEGYLIVHGMSNAGEENCISRFIREKGQKYQGFGELGCVLRREFGIDTISSEGENRYFDRWRGRS